MREISHLESSMFSASLFIAASGHPDRGPVPTALFTQTASGAAASGADPSVHRRKRRRPSGADLTQEAAPAS